MNGIERKDISYVEAHGTGTVVGDAQELAAIDFMYGSGAGRGAADPLLIGSVKSNMGHCEGCSGLAGGQHSGLACACACACARALSWLTGSAMPQRLQVVPRPPHAACMCWHPLQVPVGFTCALPRAAHVPL